MSIEETKLYYIVCFDYKTDSFEFPYDFVETIGEAKELVIEYINDLMKKDFKEIKEFNCDIFDFSIDSFKISYDTRLFIDYYKDTIEIYCKKKSYLGYEKINKIVKIAINSSKYEKEISEDIKFLTSRD